MASSLYSHGGHYQSTQSLKNVKLVTSSYYLTNHLFFPRSPRWLWNHGREKEALLVLAEIERACVKSSPESAAASKSDEKKKKTPKYEVLRESEGVELEGEKGEPDKKDSIALSQPEEEQEQLKKTPPENPDIQNLIEEPRKEPTPKSNYEHAGFLTVLRVMVITYPLRTLLGVVLMATQAFFYNSIFFSYPLVLSRDYDVDDASVGLYLIPYVTTSCVEQHLPLPSSLFSSLFLSLFPSS